ncbi:MAG: hypothetical protein ACK46Q_00555 [Hyphomonas sp.]
MWGIIFFAELPDMILTLGMVLVVGAGALALRRWQLCHANQALPARFRCAGHQHPVRGSYTAAALKGQAAALGRLRDVDEAIRELVYINATSTLKRRFQADGSSERWLKTNSADTKAFRYQIDAL